ncbi:hypothetical protein VOLCADRAFT_108084 [Volvox carteri f. nagariensis]|uniref:Bax inhibitor-1/YccA family protein n=1 Tax=Volvox carteri f. nagariensis TaxID=3068 RepID=D8UI29_VOLCA|nr:uncharacterized protein VOLCADRAFT_108084 [Volvox carteri f. nagariensis]EFJ40599.1 hypothetical protein VOLCADRAFT_108084 [Volvox carteri f. nagariensis]|eukprot:XP_002958306.1 hypothetical protein VOLCADRAFT_108084 [Volvox carteri f. nagariensis]
MLAVRPIGLCCVAGRHEDTRPAGRGHISNLKASRKLIHSGPKPDRAAVISRVMTSTSTNPAFTFGKVDDAIAESGRGGPPMTVDGAVQKTGLLLVVAVASAMATWVQIASGNASVMLAASKGAGVVALLSAMVTMFKPQWAMGTSLVFSAAQGVAMAGFSVMLEMMYPGIVLNALMLTFGTAASLLVAFQSRLIRVTDKFRDGVLMVTGGYFVMMLLTWVMTLFGVRLPSMLSGGPLGIGLGLVAASLAAANLLLDFDMIKSAARARMPKWFEWYSGFSLMMTLVWMYTEVLRLLTMFARGDRDD